MNDAWDDRRRAQEEQYFAQQEKAALERLKSRVAAAGDKPRTCPISGDALEQVTQMGVVLDRCPKCGGVWLDNGELETIIRASQQNQSWSEKFFGSLFTKS